MVDSVKLEGNFKIGNTEMVVVKTKGGASIMEIDEYKRLVKVYKKVDERRVKL